MKKLLLIQWHYLVNKLNLIIMIILTIIGLIIAVVGIKELNSDQQYQNSQLIIMYLDYYKLYYKLIIVLFCCYLWGNSFTKEKNRYHLLITDYYHQRLIYITSKIMILLFISFCIIYLLFFDYTIIGIICSNWFEVNENFLELFGISYLIVVYYGLLAAIFASCIPSDYAYMLSVAIFVFGEIIKDNVVENCFNLYYFLFPVLLDDCTTIYGSFHLVCLIGIALLWLIFLHLKSAIRKK